MLIFRSEEHLDRWLAGRERGAVISITKLAELAAAWWSDRLAPAWQPRTREQSQAILAGLGLTGSFWSLG
jgi:hypothetical protein